MIRRPSARKSALLAAAAATVLIGTTGCTLIAPQATRLEYDPADGFSADLGDVKVLDAVALANDAGTNVSLVFTVVNAGDETVVLNVAAGPAGADGSATVTVAAGGSVLIGAEGELVIPSPTDAQLGGLYDVYFQAGADAGTALAIPVVDASENRPWLLEYVQD